MRKQQKYLEKNHSASLSGILYKGTGFFFTWFYVFLTVLAHGRNTKDLNFPCIY